MKNKRVLLVDSFGLLFRSYFALEKTGLSTKNGIPTFAIYGFFRALLKAIQETQATQIIFALESTSSWRKEVDPTYKANRKEQPSLLLEQIDMFLSLLRESNLSYISLEGCEADDVLSALAIFFSKDNDADVYIYSSDKDLTQLVQGRVQILKPSKTLSQPLEIMGANEVHHKFGVWPEQIVDYLAIVGDSSDNIKGVAGIGPKTASQLLASYGTLDKIYEHLQELSLGSRSKFEKSKEQVYLAKKLVSLQQDCDFLEDRQIGTLNALYIQSLEKVFHKLEFSLDKEIQALRKSMAIEESLETPSMFEDDGTIIADSLGIQDFSQSNVKYRLITVLSDLQNLCEKVKNRGVFSLDTETTGVSLNKAILLGVSICCEESVAYYIPLNHSQISGITIEEFRETWQEVFADRSIKKIGHNIKFDYQILSRVFDRIEGLFFDTMLAAYLYKPDEKRYSLDDMSLLYCQYRKISYKDLVDGKHHKDLRSVEVEDVKNYACEDADITYRLYKILEPKLYKEGLDSIFWNIEMPLLPIIAKMEVLGIGLNTAYFIELKKEFQVRLDKLRLELYSLAGEEFNVNSPKQISKILYESLSLPKPRLKGKKSTAFSTDEETLQELRDFAFVEKLLEYRKYYKLLSTYVVPLLEKAVPSEDSQVPRIHTSFHQSGTATGRLSSSDPNLQNIPVRDEAGILIRKGFIPKPGYAFVSLDYSQIELRLMAHFSKDPFLIAAFKNGEDIHIATASKIFAKAPDRISSQERGVAKTINFGIIYGMGAIKLAKEIRVSHKEAKEFIDAYFQAFQGVKTFIEQTKKEAHQKGFVQTILGRKRFFPNINEDNQRFVSMSERMAVNTIIQGSNADLMKKCMIEWVTKKELQPSDLLLQIHDELLFEIPESGAKEVGEKIKEFMEDIYLLDVPLKVSLNIGSSWGDLKT